MSSRTATGTKSKTDMIRRALAGEFQAVARIITLVENGAPDSMDYLRELFPHTGRGFTIGITGAPGTGKSTLVDALAAHYRSTGCKVGIIAVDPTSPFTGGAILGDRIRMQSGSLDSGTFIRSMATRGHLGGLARATADALLVMDAAGFDVIFIETVGVGQDEVEIVRTAQATLVLLVPGMGDDIQAMKAGIMEIGDVFVLNKADRPGVERTESELKALLSIGSRPDSWTPSIVRTIASESHGILECAQAIEQFRKFQQSSHFQLNRSIQIHKDRLFELARTKIIQTILEPPGAAAWLESMAQRIAERKLDPYSAAESLLASLPRRGIQEPCPSGFRRIDHLGIAVRSLQDALAIYESAFGLGNATITEIPDQKVRVAIIPIGESRIELLEATDQDSPVAKFISKRGEGLHHVCFAVNDILAVLDRLKAFQVRLVDQDPRGGAENCLVAFVHPSSTAGVLVELSQPVSGSTTATSE